MVIREKLGEDADGYDDGFDKFTFMLLVIAVSAFLPLILVVLTVSKIYEFAKKALVKNMNKNETQEEK